MLTDLQKQNVANMANHIAQSIEKDKEGNPIIIGWKKETEFNGKQKTECFLSFNIVSQKVAEIRAMLNGLKGTKTFISFQELNYQDPATGQIFPTGDVIGISENDRVTVALREPKNRVNITSLGIGSARTIEPKIDPSVGF